MKNKWNQKNLNQYLKKYKGQDMPNAPTPPNSSAKNQNLVLHGGGNTSVKSKAKLITGETIDVLCVKGSGWDLATIEPAGHPALDLEALRKLRKLKTLKDEDMVNFQRTHMLDSTGPNPSIETLLHAFLPHKFVGPHPCRCHLSLGGPTTKPKPKLKIGAKENWRWFLT